PPRYHATTAGRWIRVVIVRQWMQICALGISSSLGFAATATDQAGPPPSATPVAVPLDTAAGLLDEAAATRFAQLALGCLHKEYPNKIAHVLASEADVLPPRVLTPAFYGCFDWHSDVHGHWLLVRLLRLFPNATFAKDARASLAASLTPRNIAGEVEYLKSE